MPTGPPQTTAAGIVEDATSHERKVPASVRGDGSYVFAARHLSQRAQGAPRASRLHARRRYRPVSALASA